MIKNITLGQYFPGNSVIHKLDARIKLLIAIELIVVIFCMDNWGFLLAAGLIFASCLLSKISVKHLIKGLKPLRFVLLLTFIINARYLLMGFAFFFSYPKQETVPALRCCRACGQPLDDTAKFCTACGNSAD